jgi:hypothetical protein
MLSYLSYVKHGKIAKITIVERKWGGKAQKHRNIMMT